MALFENYDRRIDKINGVLKQYGIESVEACREMCQAKGFDPYEIVKSIQPICFENACWAYTVGAAIAMKKGVKTAAEAATAIGEGLQAFCIDGSVADDRKVGLGHGNLAERARALISVAHPSVREELEKAAIKVGADVPFFLHGQPRRVTGIGEVLTPATVDLPGWWLVLVCPPVSVSTPWAYRAYDDLMAEAEKAGDKGLTNPESKDNETLLVMGKYAGTGTTFRITTENVLQIRNDLEPAVVREYPQLETIRQHLLHSGAACARMSGSGSSMFGLFSARHAAEAAAQSLESQYGKVFVLPMNAGM